MIQDTSRLLSLSTEVLLLVLENLHSTSLLAVCKVSRRLHYLAIPIYLFRYHVYNPEPISLILQKKAIAALPGLTASLSITSLDSLSCKFEGPDELLFTWDITHLLQFIHKLSSLRAVTLNMGNIDARWIDGLVTASSDKWKPTFISLLDMILDRQCTSLTITHGHFIVSLSASDYGPALPQKPGPFVSTVPAVPMSNQTFLAKFKIPLSRRRKLLPVTPVPLRTTLHSFSVHSNMLFSQPFYDWTLHTLNTSAIVELSIRLSALRLDIWAVILQSLTIPTLAVFTVESIDISFPDLVRFLFRHPSITTLNLHPHFTYPQTKALPRRPRKRQLLPQLTTIGGTPMNVAAMISHLHPDTAQHLHTLTLTLPKHQRVFQPSDFESLTTSIVNSVQDAMTLTALSLRFSVPLHESFPPAFKSGENSSTSAMRKAVFHSVKTLAFSTDGTFAFAKWVIPVLPAWLAKFVRLQHVRLAQDCVPGELDGRIRLLGLIKASCSRVRTVTFGEEIQILR